MSRILTEENGKYGIDCTKTIWCADDVHLLYHKYGMAFLKDVDFVLETDEYMLLVEYKNANIPEALSHVKDGMQYDPFEDRKFDSLVKKFYDTIHYLLLAGKMLKPVKYIFVLEYPNGNSSSRRLLRNRMKKCLPFRLQEHMDRRTKLIESVDVLNIEEWNRDPYYRQFPIIKTKERGI